MGKLVIHAGMPKCGSSSLQQWLADHAGTLHEEHGIRLITPCFASTDPADAPAGMRPYESGSVSSGPVIAHYFEHKKQGAPEAYIDAFFAALEDGIEGEATFLVTGESFAHPFWSLDRRFIRGLAGIADRHPVTVAYYVRPQDTTLEAAWRQWGFRSGHTPSAFLRDRVRQLHYWHTLCGVRELAPEIAFLVRPFRTDLLTGGGIVPDFLEHVLGIGSGALPSENRWVNRGLPLELVNLLNHAEPGRFWSTIHDNSKLNRLKRLVNRIEVPEPSAAIERSRLLLQRYCHSVFEPDNLALGAALGWGADHFIAPPPPASDVESDGGEESLEPLDDLWSPQGADTDIALLLRLLEAAIS